MNEKNNKFIKRFPANEKIDALLTVLTKANRGVFDLSSDAKAYRLLTKFTSESCTFAYEKMREVLTDGQRTYKLYSAENLMLFFVNDEVIDFIVNSEKWNYIKVMYSKKFLATVQSKEWKKLEYVPEKNEEAEKFAKLEKEYKDFVAKCPVFYKFRQFNPKGRYMLNEPTFLVYDGTNKKNINVIWEFPSNGKTVDTAHYITMCKVHWCKSNKYKLSEKFADARVMGTEKFVETIINQ